MAKEKKIRRGTTAEHATFVGALSEITVDTDKDTLVIHDAVTVGGFPLAREDLSNVSDIPYEKLATLTAGQTIIGNSSNVPTATTITGDISISSLGVVQISTGVIVDSDVSNTAQISDTKLATIFTANKVSISALNIDGATDIGGVLTDDDLFIVDDGGTGTNRKSSLTRIPVYTFEKVYSDIQIASDGNAQIQPEVIVNADISPNAEIAVSKLADGSARQLLQTDAAGTGVEWTNDVDIPGTLDVTSTATFDNIVQVPVGSVTAPTLTFTGFNTTGIYSSAPNELAITTSGVRRVMVNASGINLTGDLIGTTTLGLYSTTTGTVTLDSGTTGAINIGTNSNSKTITIGNTTGTTSLVLRSGTGGIDITTGSTGNLTLDSGTTGSISIGTNSNAKIITIGNNTNATSLSLLSGTGGISLTTATTGNLTLDSGTTGAISIGANSNSKVITLGNNSGTTGVTVNSGTGGITLLTGTTGIISIDSGTTGAINVGTGSGSKAVTVGNNNGSTSLSLRSGTGGVTISTGTTGVVNIDSGTTGAVNIATGSNAKTVTIGNTTTTTQLVLRSGTGGISLLTGTTGNVSIDSGTTGSIGIGTNANAKTITIGNETVNSTIELDNNTIVSPGKTLTLSGATSGTISLVATSVAGTNTITLPPNTGTVALTNFKLSVFASTTSVELASVISDETGTGALVFANTPTLVTPILGTPTSGTLTNCTGLPISTGVSGLATGMISFLTTPTSANLAATVTDETGTGSLVFSNSPTLVTPTLGVATATSINKVTITTPAIGSTLTIADGKTLTVSNTLTFTGTDASSVNFASGGTVAYTGGKLSQFASTTSSELAGVISDETGTGSLVFANSPTLVTPVLGTPTSGTLTNCTGLPISTGVSGLATGVSTFLSNPTSSNLLSVITDETGTGSLVFSTSPTISNVVLTGTLTAAGGTGNAGQVLTSTGTGIQWLSPATPASNLPINQDNTTNTNYYPTLTALNGGSATELKVSDLKLIFNTSTGILSATGFSGSAASLTSIPAGNLTGTISNTVLGNSSVFIGTTSIPLNRTTGAQTLTGVSIDGNSATTTRLQTSRTINGVSFDGTANITITSNTTNSLTFNNGGTGAASGTTFNGSAAQTISYNTIGAPSVTGANASGTWGINITGNAATVTNGVYNNGNTYNIAISGNATTATTSSFLNSASSSTAISDIRNRLNSGFYETSNSLTTNGWPESTNNYYHLFTSTNSSGTNNYSLQLAADFYTQKLWYRSTNNSGTTSWSRVILDNNINSYSPTLTGTGASGTWGISVTGTSSSWSTGRTISLGGDLSGSVSIDGTSNVTLNATIQPNSVALGTDTTGNYVSGVTTTGVGISASGSGEDATVTITSNATSVNTASTIVARDASGNFSAGTITASLSGNATTATNISGYSGTYWTSNNDGASSGLDADLLDGQQGSFYTTAGNLTGTIPSAVLGNSSLNIGTTSIALNRASSNLALTGISSITLPGSTSGNVVLQPTSTAGTTTITLPATTGTVITSGDTGTVTSTMIADGTIVNGDISASAAIAVSKLSASTISGITLGNNLNTLTLNVSGTGLSGSTTYNGSVATTFTVTSNATSVNTASTIVARDASGNFSAGTITATNFSGGGSSLTSLNASNITSGTVAAARLGSGTANSTTFLRGDNTWATITSGLTVSDDTTTNATRYLTFTSSTSGSITSENVSSTKLTFNPSTGDLVVGGTVTANSDISLKENIKTLENSLEKTLSLRGVEFDYKDSKVHQIGVIAQEVEAVIPELVVETNGVKSVAYSNMVALLIEAIKEQNTIINSMKSEIEELKQMITK